MSKTQNRLLSTKRRSKVTPWNRYRPRDYSKARQDYKELLAEESRQAAPWRMTDEEIQDTLATVRDAVRMTGIGDEW